MEHTAEPWHIDPKPTDDEGYRISSEPGTNPSYDDPMGMEWIATVYDGNALGPGPNARRIVACVNACKGIPIDLLEDPERKLVVE